MPRRVLPATAVCLVVALGTGGCFGGSSAAPTSTPKRTTPTHGPSKGTIRGRAFTTACGPLSGSCGQTPYRGSLVFCRTMNEIGPCPSARVDASGRFQIRLMAGRYALVPAPGRSNVVDVTPRWVTVGMGQVKVITINGGSLTD
jgi:hypothetical protein